MHTLLFLPEKCRDEKTILGVPSASLRLCGVTSFYLFFTVLLSFPLLLSSQQLTSERVIPIRDVDLRDMGFPIKAVAAGTDRFAFLQYWSRDSYHGADNFYLQCLSTGEYVAEWFVPVTEAGFEPMQVAGLFALKGGLVVTGKQYLAKEKMAHTVGRFFDLEGKAMSKEPVQLSTHDRKAEKGLMESFSFSPEKNTLLWMGTDGKRYFFSAWDSKGKQRWGKELNLPYLDEKYQVSRVVVDEKGNPSFLLEFDKPTYTIKDTLHPPVLVHYNFAKDAFLSDTLHIDSAYVAELQLAQIGGDEIAIMGILSTNDYTGLTNGALASDEPRRWNQLFCQRYRISDTLALEADSVSELPASWREAYQKEGCNFTSSQVFAEGNTVAWVFEEAYSSKDRQYFYDLGCLGFDLRSGALRWDEVVKKRQRTQGSERFLSYVAGIAKGKLHLVYLSELGAPGKILCSSLDLRSGKRSDHELASNENTLYLFFPTESGMTGEDTMILIGMGYPDQNDFKLMTLRF